MKYLAWPAILGAASMLSLAACSSSPYAGNSVYEGHGSPGADSISRNISHAEGGTVEDPLEKQQPPVRRDYVEDR